LCMQFLNMVYILKKKVRNNNYLGEEEKDKIELITMKIPLQ